MWNIKLFLTKELFTSASCKDGFWNGGDGDDGGDGCCWHKQWQRDNDCCVSTVVNLKLTRKMACRYRQWWDAIDGWSSWYSKDDWDDNVTEEVINSNVKVTALYDDNKNESDDGYSDFKAAVPEVTCWK